MDLTKAGSCWVQVAVWTRKDPPLGPSEASIALIDTALKALKHRIKPYAVADDRGLYMEVFPAAGVVWRYRYRFAGQRKKLALGKYPALTLKNARIKRDEAAQAAAMNKSPSKQKRYAKPAAADASTVAEFSERFFIEVLTKDRQDIFITRRI